VKRPHIDDLFLSLRRALNFPKLVWRNAESSQLLENPIRPVAIGRASLGLVLNDIDKPKHDDFGPCPLSDLGKVLGPERADVFIIDAIVG
jgi:hypothetical protein